MKLIFILFTILFLGCGNYNYRPTLNDIREAQQLIDRGVLYLRSNNAQKALATFEMALEINYSSEALDGVGSAYFLMGEYEKAQTYFLKAYNEDNSYAPALEHLALLYEMYHYNEEAEILYKQALDLNPKLYSARNNKAVFLYENRIMSKTDTKTELLKAQEIFNNKIIRDNLRYFQ